MSEKKNILNEVKFSKCIRKHPCIWYSNHDDYKNKQVKEEAWKEIAKKMKESSKIVQHS